LPGCTGRGPPADLLLKEDLPDEDPLELERSSGPGFSMAPPPAEHRALSAGLSLEPPSPLSAAPGSGSLNSALLSQEIMHRKSYPTPPATASTAEPSCITPDRWFSTTCSLNSTLNW
jgi:hypothetical protein